LKYPEDAVPVTIDLAAQSRPGLYRVVAHSWRPG
jgi:hypothetical protein